MRLSLICLAILSILWPCFTAIELRNPRAFFQQCHRIRDVHFDNRLRAPTALAQRPSSSSVGVKCTTYKCFALEAASARDLRHLQSLECGRDTDCLTESTRMICRQFEGFSGRKLSLCDCPKGQAYNPLSCKCELAQPCYESPYCLNGKRCGERFCQCDSFVNKLIDPHSQMCVEKLNATDIAGSGRSATTGGGAEFTTAVVFLCLISIVLVVLVGIMLSQGPLQGFCDQGQYVCDDVKVTPTNRNTTNTDNHVAAWELPGLDYLSEEQTMKYLNRGRPPSPPVDTSTPNSQPLRRIGGTHRLDQDSPGGGSIQRAVGGQGVHGRHSPGGGSSPSPSASEGASLPESDRPASERFEQTAHHQAVISHRADGGTPAERPLRQLGSKTNSVETVQSHIL